MDASILVMSHSIAISKQNISSYFTSSSGSYTFSWNSSGTILSTTNGGVKSSTASLILTTKQNLTVSLNYSYASETNFDKFTFIAGGNTILNAVSGPYKSGRWHGELNKGDQLKFTYSKDGSQDANGDVCKIWNIVITDDSFPYSLTKAACDNVYLRLPGNETIIEATKAWIGAKDNTPKLLYSKD